MNFKIKLLQRQKIYDIIFIENSYTYNAFGNTTVAYYNGDAGTTAAKNPFRYRGYYYDIDLGL